MIGQSFVVKVTPEGKIVEFDGFDEMYQRMAEPVVDNEDEATRQKMAETLRTRERAEESAQRAIDRANLKHGSREKRIEATREKLAKGPYSREENIREMLDNVIMSFAGRPVGIGDSWQAWNSLLSFADLDLDACTYTLRENRQAAVLVGISSKIEVDDELVSGEDGSPGSSRATLAGSSEGSLEIDPITGWMLRKNVTMHYSGQIKTAPTERNPQGRTTEMSIESVITVEPIE